MREFAFKLNYDKGADEFMDLFLEEPSLTAQSINASSSRDCHWLVERFVAPEPVLDKVEAIRCSTGRPKEEMTESTCGAVRHPSVLERSATSLVTYMFVERLHTCNSVYAIAARRLERGFIIQSQRRGDTHETRILTRSNENIEEFYESLRESLADGISADFGHFNGVSQWNFDSLASVSVSQEQRKMLRKAINHGYYETPRQITTAELAETLDVPQSTVSYRLRQAESQLVKGYFDMDGMAVAEGSNEGAESRPFDSIS